MKPDDDAVERAAAHIYQEKADRLGRHVIGWENEPEDYRRQWRDDVRETISAYLDLVAQPVQ